MWRLVCSSYWCYFLDCRKHSDRQQRLHLVELRRYTRSLIYRLLLYSGCSRKSFTETLLPASFAASSSEDSKTSQVTKLRWQNDRHGISAVLRSSPNVSFLIPASLLVLKSVIMKDRVLGSTSATSSGIGSITLSLRYGAYLPSLSFSYCSNVLLLTAQETGGTGVFTGVLCAGCMELVKSKWSLVSYYLPTPPLGQDMTSGSGTCIFNNI